MRVPDLVGADVFVELSVRVPDLVGDIVRVEDRVRDSVAELVVVAEMDRDTSEGDMLGVNDDEGVWERSFQIPEKGRAFAAFSRGGRPYSSSSVRKMLYRDPSWLYVPRFTIGP